MESSSKFSKSLPFSMSFQKYEVAIKERLPQFIGRVTKGLVKQFCDIVDILLAESSLVSAWCIGMVNKKLDERDNWEFQEMIQVECLEHNHVHFAKIQTFHDFLELIGFFEGIKVKNHNYSERMSGNVLQYFLENGASIYFVFPVKN